MAVTVLANANVITCDRDGSITTAVAIENGRIAAVGDLRDIKRTAGTGAVEVDLQGATVLPGFIDTHPHLMHFGALAEPLVDLFDVPTHAEISRRIARRAAGTPDGEWVMATPVGEPHYFIRRSFANLAEGELPDRAVLDGAAPRNPVFIQAWAPVTPNACVFNSVALKQLGITRDTPDEIDNVTVEKDAAGEPTGRLFGAVTNYYADSEFMKGLLRRLPMFQIDAIAPGTLRAMRRQPRLGSPPSTRRIS